MPGATTSSRSQASRPPGPRAPRRPPPGPPSRPAAVAGLQAACQAAGLSALAVMVLVLVGWATTPDTGASATTAVSAGLQVWLVGHGGALRLPDGTFSLLPLGLVALPVAVVHTATVRAGRVAQVRGRRSVLVLTSSVTATYAVLATAVGLVASTGQVRPDPVTVFAGAVLLAGSAATTGAVQAARRWPALWHLLPGPVRLAAPAAAGALATLVAGGTLVGGASLAAHGGRATLLVDALDPGVGGGVLLLLGCLLYVPTAAVWGLAYAVGPGFATGLDGGVGPFGSDPGAVPAFPLLAALPAEGTSTVGALALVVPLAAGVVAGLLLRRTMGRQRPAPELGPAATARLALVAGAGVAAVTSLLAAAASGAAGPGRFAQVGPDWWSVGPLAGLEVAVVAAATMVVLRSPGTPRLSFGR